MDTELLRLDVNINILKEVANAKVYCNILTRYNIDGAKCVSTPIFSTISLDIHDGEPMVDATDFRKFCPTATVYIRFNASIIAVLPIAGTVAVAKLRL
nr:Retrovirus-related Pol polyprotein from transposon RE2 [Ipomoea batatas]